MIVVGVIAVFLIQLNLKRDQYREMTDMVAEMAATAEAGGGKLPEGARQGRWLDELADRYDQTERVVMFILDGDGAIVQQFPPNPPDEARQLNAKLPQIMTGEPQIFALESIRDRPPYLVAAHALRERSGYVLLLLPENNFMDTFVKNGVPRLILSCTMALTGWGVIYVLTRRLIKPIQDAADAAKQVVAGNYDVHLSKEHQEREIYELMHAFKEMADRLSWLESLRTQLLAGVTHELKTPVASISGLVQAVKEGVVSEQDKDYFLEICLKECARLQKMVEDLLEFNTFAGNAVVVVREPCDLDALVREICTRWQHSREDSNVRVSVETELGVAGWQTSTDPDRLEQIMINLLNNARDAMGHGGDIYVRLLTDSNRFRIQVKDTGHGIPAAEQLDIFEPFYRGKQKMAKVRGMGIGLPFSRLIGRSLNGDLVLTDSSPEGTTFTLFLPFE
jgi:signal transduction histidine kinase